MVPYKITIAGMTLVWLAVKQREDAGHRHGSKPLESVDGSHEDQPQATGNLTHPGKLWTLINKSRAK